jgi:hypothetical protein
MESRKQTEYPTATHLTQRKLHVRHVLLKLLKTKNPRIRNPQPAKISDASHRKPGDRSPWLQGEVAATLG